MKWRRKLKQIRRGQKKGKEKKYNRSLWTMNLLGISFTYPFRAEICSFWILTWWGWNHKTITDLKPNSRIYRVVSEFSVQLGIGFTVGIRMWHPREHLLHCSHRLHPCCLVLTTLCPQMHSLLRPLVHRESPLIDGLRLTNFELEFSNWFTEVGLCAGLWERRRMESSPMAMNPQCKRKT